MSDQDQRLFSLANTAALVLFTENNSPRTVTLSQKVLAEHGASLLAAYKETVVTPTVASLVNALTKVAIVHHVRLAEGGGTVPSGYSCEICEAECDQGQPLMHVGDCPLTVLNPNASTEPKQPRCSNCDDTGVVRAGRFVGHCPVCPKGEEAAPKPPAHELVPFLAMWAMQYQRDHKLDGLHPVHYDLMKKYGARMVDFKRATNASALETIT